MKIRAFNGCDLLDSQIAVSLLSDKRLGLISNSCALLKTKKTVASEINEKYKLCALFSGEHGFNTQKQAGSFDNEVFTESETGVPVYNLFGGEEALRRAEELFSNLDCIVFDIQDIGTRYYTYQYTMLDALRLCKKTNTDFVVLDRMNPLGLKRFEGNLLESRNVSDVGRVPGQPTVLGITIGEIALWYNEFLSIGTKVSVVACKGVTRETMFEDTDLEFIPPSPNLRNLNALFLYAGTCLFEGTNLSEGRGTQKPFEMFGAPWLDPEKVICYLKNLTAEEQYAYKGLRFTPCTFSPTFSDYKGECCKGVEIEIVDKSTVNMFETGLQLIKAMQVLYPDKTELSDHLGNLAGTSKIYDKNFNPHEYINFQTHKLKAFKLSVEPYLIYK